ncbi:hypothetical protein GCM10027169_31260 [Gordonia jinhuaensis]|uniref:Citrate synthase n=1 Tax=Gordonia jinhuaensis TaxID=1517702 RepID=A0A916WVM4_9ACTN|nr:citrate/2-methylcitrate synthase [Gordonia jinhuaensis]GGB33505.1 hypothetical protein GCM10011489_22060 [Gordonia jinhuaensis]
MTVIAPRGLRDVVVADTEIGRVDGDAGFYQYRQYSAIDLAEHATFEQVWFLFARGHLPDDDELSEFVATITPLREVPPATMSLLHQVGQSLTSRGMLGGLRTVCPRWAPARRRCGMPPRRTGRPMHCGSPR